jgi:hypothetical protein
MSHTVKNVLLRVKEAMYNAPYVKMDSTITWMMITVKNTATKELILIKL